MTRKEKIKNFLSAFLLAAVLAAAVFLQIKPDSSPSQKKTENDTKQSNTATKFDLLPIAASRAVPAIAHISLVSKDSGKQQPECQHSGLNIYKPLQSNDCITLGSGVVVSPDGYILTNSHVVENFPNRIRVGLNENSEKRSYTAKIVGLDPKTDLAVIKINANNLPYIKFGNSDDARVGEVVLAVGNPFGIGESVTMGVISATGRSNIGIVDYENFIQTDAAINPGNSGGALVNMKGELIGLNTAILTKSGGYEGISFSIPSNMAQRVYKEILRNGKVERGWIGVAVQNLNDTAGARNSGRGILVVDVVAGSPARISGIQKGDIVVSMNGVSLKNRNHLRNMIAIQDIGRSIKLGILRKGSFIEVPVSISRLPDDVNIFAVNH